MGLVDQILCEGGIGVGVHHILSLRVFGGVRRNGGEFPPDSAGGHEGGADSLGIPDRGDAGGLARLSEVEESDVQGHIMLIGVDGVVGICAEADRESGVVGGELHALVLPRGGLAWLESGVAEDALDEVTHDALLHGQFVGALGVHQSLPHAGLVFDLDALGEVGQAGAEFAAGHQELLLQPGHVILVEEPGLVGAVQAEEGESVDQEHGDHQDECVHQEDPRELAGPEHPPGAGFGDGQVDLVSLDFAGQQGASQPEAGGGDQRHHQIQGVGKGDLDESGGGAVAADGQGKPHHAQQDQREEHEEHLGPHGGADGLFQDGEECFHGSGARERAVCRWGDCRIRGKGCVREPPRTRGRASPDGTTVSASSFRLRAVRPGARRRRRGGFPGRSPGRRRVRRP